MLAGASEQMLDRHLPVLFLFPNIVPAIIILVDEKICEVTRWAIGQVRVGILHS